MHILLIDHFLKNVPELKFHKKFGLFIVSFIF